MSCKVQLHNTVLSVK